ncbi:MAG: DUF4240 domain-containing protein [Pseudomonadota bacterium]
MPKPFEFNFKDLDRDAERYIDAYQDCYEEAKRRDIWAFTVARERTFEAYMAAGADDQICHWLRTQQHYNLGTTQPFEDFLAYFKDKGAIRKVDELWRHAAGEMAAEISFYRLHLGRGTTQLHIDEGIALALTAHRRWRSDIEATATPRQLALLDEKIRRIETNAKPSAKKKADPSPMTESLFWDVVETTDDIDPIEAMIARLSDFKSTAIKTWYKMLWTEMDRLYRNDLWALAYVLHGGCSDDNFEEFRSGIIRMGRTWATCIPDDLPKLAEHLVRSPRIDGALLFAVADEAYERRTGNPMLTPRRKLPMLDGPDWMEETVETDFPEIVSAVAQARG